MAPSDESLEKDLRDGVRAIVDERGWDEVTVNNVRQHVEKKGGLKKGFFKEADWEARSKDIIKEFVAKLLAENDEPPSSPAAAKAKPEPKNGVKRQSSEEPSPAPKRQKKAARAAPSKKVKSKKEESESELSDLKDISEFEEAPKEPTTAVSKKEDSDSELSDLKSSEDESTKVKPQNLASRRKSKKEESESELSDLSDSEHAPKKKQKQKQKQKQKGSKKAAPVRKSKIGIKEDEASDMEDSSAPKKRKRAGPIKKRNSKPTIAESDEEEDLVPEKSEAMVKDNTDSNIDDNAETSIKASGLATSKSEELEDYTKPKDIDDQDTKAANGDDSSSELSSVIDDPPPKKRRSKDAKGASKGASKAKQTKEPSGDEAEIKKLQGQLLKCGIRKIWGIELKKYGDDSKAKLRHLRGILRDIGIEGRFSEAKAKEIKEKRELMADLEAVTEMNRNWGSGGGSGRASRSKAKTVKKPTEEESDGNNEDGGENEDGIKAKPRVSKRMADLAFLGSDSGSE